jgi:alkylation response protein AidB-like acyl-CoA dehydrogenase
MSPLWNTFGFTEEQRMMRDSVLALLGRALPPETIRKLDAEGEFPREAYAALAQAGWMGLPFPEQYGGSGGSYKDLAVLVEAIAYHYASMATAYLITCVYAAQHIALFGSEKLRKEFLPAVAQGKCRMAIAISEPEAGSDAAAIRTRAERKGDRYLVSGQKTYITCAHVADCVVTIVKTDPAAGRNGISALLVDAKAPGVTIRPMQTLGRRTTRPNEIFFDAVEVPAERLIGEENRAWKALMRCLNLERLCIAASGAGNLMHVIDYALEYARNRKAFGRRICEFQVIQHKFADMRIMAETARLTTFRAAEMLDAGLDPRIEIAIAKIVATENDFACADLGMQIMGGAGYLMEHDMQRFFRDARIGPVGGGSNEIQRNIIAQLMGLERR